MSEFKNVFDSPEVVRSTAPYSRAAAASFGLSCATIVGVMGAYFYPYLALLHLLFPAAIVLGHIGLRRTNADAGSMKGRSAAIFGLYVGYFNLLIMLFAVFVVVSSLGG